MDTAFVSLVRIVWVITFAFRRKVENEDDHIADEGDVFEQKFIVVTKRFTREYWLEVRTIVCWELSKLSIAVSEGQLRRHKIKRG